ncbi:carboxypeptidase regulatory-like domain-containing protein [Deminuibacter soli]|nr:carboxypeptidase-like regulatory domain-containing protein [Deminuibacter soli]
MILSFTDMYHATPVLLRGRVVSGADHQPVSRAYITAVQGEEETLTDTSGNFTLRTWQALPVTITIQHGDYKSGKLVISDTSQLQQVQLLRR